MHSTSPSAGRAPAALPADRRGETYGLVLTALGVLVISPDTLLIRLAADAGSIATIFWRNLFVGTALLFVLILREGRGAGVALTGQGVWGWVSIGLLTFANLGFVLAVNSTSVANVLVIIATMPLFAALLARVWLGEAIRARTAAAIIAATAGIIIVVSGSIGGGTLGGDLAALAVTFAHGANLVVMRRRGGQGLLPSLVLAAFAAALIAAPFAEPLAVPPEAMGWIALSGLVQMPLGYVLFFGGLRWVAAAEVALMTLLETVVAPVWVWLALAEVPDDRALLGGAIVLGAIGINAAAGLRTRRRVQGLPPG